MGSWSSRGSYLLERELPQSTGLVAQQRVGVVEHAVVARIYFCFLNAFLRSS